VHFNPRLPEGWSRMRFRVQVRGQLIEVDMTADGTSYTLLEGRGLLIYDGDEEIRLLPEAELIAA
jgi:alpha,alpha-trehalose phosphorylase